MFFEYSLAVEANTLKRSPATVDAILCVGTVSNVSVQFPAGCAGMVYVSIRRGGRQVWPGNPDDAISGEDAIIWWPEAYPLDELPYAFEVRAWSPGTTYDHTITVRFAVEPLLKVEPEEVLEVLAPGLAELLGW